jgi:hypothetical protein
MLEARGTPTTTIGLVRSHMEQTRPPRGLWVPFQLGRPLGEPEDAASQRRVLLQALGLLEREDGPVILEDFPDDPPNWTDTAGWVPPILPAPPVPTDPAGWAEAFASELASLEPAWTAARARYGRTTVSLSAQEPSEWPGFAARVLAGELPTVAAHATTALAVRFLCDDVKAMYGEAAQAVGAAPSSWQIDTWFWRGTLGGRLLIELRSAAMQSENNALKTVGGRFFVPGQWLQS